MPRERRQNPRVSWQPAPQMLLGGDGSPIAAAPVGGRARYRGEQGPAMDALPPVLQPERLGVPLPIAVSTLKTVPPAFLVLLHHHHSENMLLCALQDFPSQGPPAPTPPQGGGGLVEPEEKRKFPFLSPQSQASELAGMPFCIIDTNRP